MSRAAIVVNPVKTDPEKLREALAAAEHRHGWEDTLWLETTEDDPGAGQTRAALEQGVDVVIAAGGDGTVGCAANAITGTPALLAVLPLGTSNDVARSLGISPDPLEAAGVIVDGQVCEVDVARVCVDGQQPRTFVNAATAGLNVAFARLATTSSLRRKFGGLTYPIAAARALRSYEPFECTIERDDGEETLSAVHVSVSNAPVFGGVLGMRVPRASMTDGCLDLIVVERLSITRLVFAIADTFIGLHQPVHRVHTARVKSVRLSAEEGQEISIDGEVVGCLPAEFRIEPGALRVAVPRLG